jgi:tRNA-modifying protein YgfZ
MSSGLFKLTALGALSVRGPEAREFLQRQLSSDLDEVSGTQGQFSGWHDPKGRVLAFFRILPAPDGFRLVMHAALVESIARRLRLYVLRARVEIEPAPAVLGLAADGDAPASLGETLLESGPLAAFSSPAFSTLRLPGQAGWLVVGDPGLPAATDAGAEAAWQRAELEAGLPEVYPATSGAFVAQMINLDRLGAVSFTKGCFPGQEIVARAHHLGRVKRRARLFRAPGPAPAPGESLADSRGTVVRTADSDDGCLLLAVVPEDFAGPLSLADGRVLKSFPAETQRCKDTKNSE